MKKTFRLAMAAMTLFFLALPVQAQSVPGVTIIRISQYSDFDDYPQISPIYRNPSTRTLARAQEEIRNTPEIRQLLERRRIPVGRVKAVATALNGGKVVYVD